MATRNGWYLDISNKEYHEGEGISKSDIALLLQSPAHFKTPQKEETPAMIQGEAFHVLTLQPELFEKQFAVMPLGLTRVKKEGKDFVAGAEAFGKEVIPYEVYQQIKGMRDAVLAHPGVAEILSVGQAEVSGYWSDIQYPNILLKIRPDWINTKSSIILDLKSTMDARPGPFSRIAYDKGYHLQAGLYTCGAQILTAVEHRFYFAAVERDPPHGTILYEASQEMILEGMKEAQRGIGIYQRCLESDAWPCYSAEIVTLSLPGWVKRKQEIFG